MRELSKRLNTVHAVDVRVLPGQDRGAARRADGVGREHVRQQRALARQPIEVRRLVDARPVRADRVRRVVVRHDEDDVRTVGGETMTDEQDGDERRTPARTADAAYEHARHASTQGRDSIDADASARRNQLADAVGQVGVCVHADRHPMPLVEHAQVD